MKIQIIQIADRGIPHKERLHLSVLAETNLHFFVVLKTSYEPTATGVLRIPTNTYWFGARPVKAGDQIVLYTSGGTDQSHLRSDGHTDHFLYWGAANTLWNSPPDCAVVLEIAEWATSPFGR